MRSPASAAPQLDSYSYGDSDWREFSGLYSPRDRQRAIAVRSPSPTAATSAQREADAAVVAAFREARSPPRQRPLTVRPAWEEGESHNASLPPFRDSEHEERYANAVRKEERHKEALRAPSPPPRSRSPQPRLRARSPSSKRPMLTPSTLSVDESALKRAASVGDVEGVARCLANGANPNDVSDGTRWTALHTAAEIGMPRLIRMLVQAHADPSIATARNGDTALHVVADNAEAVRVLLEAGAQPGHRNRRGLNAVDVARAAGKRSAAAAMEGTDGASTGRNSRYAVAEEDGEEVQEPQQEQREQRPVHSEGWRAAERLSLAPTQTVHDETAVSQRAETKAELEAPTQVPNEAEVLAALRLGMANLGAA